MMKKNNLLRNTIGIFFLSIFFNLRSQNLVWARACGGNVADLARSLAVDASGNVFYTGVFEGIVDFDPGPGTFTLSSLGTVDVFVAKLDAAGNFVWAKAIGGVSTDAAFSIALDANANVYISGSFSGSVDFDPGPGTYNMTSAASSYDAFLLKLDAAGNFVWSHRFGSNDSDHGFALTADASGNVFMTGYFNQTVDFDPGLGTYNLVSGVIDDIYVVKLDATGNFVWARAVGGNDVDAGYGITLDGAGNVLVTGAFNASVDFDPGIGIFNLTSAGSTDAFVLKLNSSGDFVWARSFGGSSSDEARSIATDAANNVVTTGFFELNVDFDPGLGLYVLGSNGVLDAFVSKLDAGGNFIWANNIGGSGNDAGYGVCIDAGSNIYTCGYFSSTVDFDIGLNTYTLSSAGAGDVYLNRFDASGSFVWAKSFGDVGNDQGYAIATNTSNNIYSCGNFQGSVDFDPNAGVTTLASVGGEDLFVHKMCQIPMNIGAINGTTLLCSGQTNIYSVTAVSGATTYSWNLAGGWSGSSTSTSISATSGSSGIFTVSAGNSCGFSLPQNITVSVNPTPSVNISGSNTLCLGASISLTASGANTYSWSNGATTAIVALNPIVTSTYSVIGTSSISNCSNTAQTTLTVVTCVGLIDRNGLLGQLRVFPNPSGGEFQIEYMDLMDVKVEIQNIMGKIVYCTDLKTSYMSIKHLGKGVYFCKFFRENESRTIKILIE
ncbi:MAG: T9SS type A sorting domain-containing protein [Sphingobacteriaceae bacterium]|nr:T9SS type A sorting domain-containing protein [Sphingobacteriaceae bacterium]